MEDGLPFILPNLALVGDKVRNFSVKFTPTPWIQAHKHHINVPSYAVAKEESDQQIMTRGALWRMKLFYSMKFRGAKETVYLAQLLLSYKMANIHKRRTLQKIRGQLTYSDERLINEKINEGTTLTKRERTLYELNKSLHVIPYGDSKDLFIKVTREVQRLYEHGSIEQFVRDMILQTAPVMNAYSSADVKDYISSAVRRNLKADMSDMIINADTEVIWRAFILSSQAVSDAQSYARDMEVTDYVWKSYVDEEGNSIGGRYLTKKISEKQIRYRVTKLVRLLEMRERSGYAMYKKKNVPEELPSSNAVSKDQEDKIVIPNGISDSLAEEIMEEAEKNYQRNLVDYRSADEGVHGKAMLFPFTPNKPIHKAIRELAKHNSDRGVVPRNMHRMTTDKKVFSRKKSVAGGSMMIDCSGSMGFSPSDVEEIVDLLPASNIAGYVGYNTTIDEKHGMIKVIAKDGRMDTDSFDKLDDYGNNSVDFEALQWLASMPEPRIWVSDQQVIGVDENTGRCINLDVNKRQEISNFMRKHNIIPIEDIEKVKSVAKELSLKR